MAARKSMDFGPYVGRVEFFALDETIIRTDSESLFRRNLYVADETQPGGMKLVKRGDIFRCKSDGYELPRPFVLS